MLRTTHLALLALLALAPTASATPDSAPVTVQVPPSTYVHHYDGPLSIVEGTLAETRARCAALRAKRADHAYGCQVFYGDVVASSDGKSTLPWCHVYVATDVHPLTRVLVLQHELAHCNGWRHE